VGQASWPAWASVVGAGHARPAASVRPLSKGNRRNRRPNYPVAGQPAGRRRSDARRSRTASPAQTTTPATPLPDYVIYDAFFYRVKWLSDLAGKFSSQGKVASANYLQSLVQTQAQLTAQESAALKAVVADWRTGDVSIVSAGKTLVKAGAAANAAQLQALALQRRQWVATHVSQLQTAMGTARFQQLDSFVRATSTVKGGTAAPGPK
jgi:hypothetical protein